MTKLKITFWMRALFREKKIEDASPTMITIL